MKESMNKEQERKRVGGSIGFQGKYPCIRAEVYRDKEKVRKDMSRFILQRSTRQQGWWVCTDKEHNIVCRFQAHRYNETQEFTLLDGDKFDNEQEALRYATYIREMADWLRDNHYDKVF